MRAWTTLAALALAAAPLAAGDEAAPVAPAPRVTLAWTAKQESQAYGYLIYRASRREGPYLRINHSIVRVTGGGSGEASRYEYVDTTVEPGGTYFYYLDTIGRNGLKARFTGVVVRTVEPPP